MFKSPKIFFHLLKGPDTSYLVLKFSNILLINNWDKAQNVISQRSWPWKVKVIGQNKWHHQIPWPWKHISRCQNRHPKCLSWKVMVKDVFLLNGGKCNTFAYVTRSNRSRCFLIYWKAPIQATKCSNLVTICPAGTEIWPKMWFYIIVTLKGQGHPWGQ